MGLEITISLTLPPVVIFPALVLVSPLVLGGMLDLHGCHVRCQGRHACLDGSKRLGMSGLVSKDPNLQG